MYTLESQQTAENVLKSIRLKFGEAAQVAARQGTVVGNLADLVIREATANIQVSGLDLPKTLNDLIQFSIPTNGQVSPDGYDYYFGSVVDEIANSVNSHLSFAKNVVAPCIKEYAEKVITAMKNKPNSPESQFNIIKMELPAPLKDGMLVDDVLKNTDISNEYPDLIALDAEKFEARLDWVYRIVQTGNSGTDASIGPWVMGLCPLLTRHVLREYFKFDLDIGVDSDKEFKPEHSVKDRIDEALLVYLVASGLFNKDPLQKNTTVNEYQSALAQYKYYSANILKYEIDTYEINTKEFVVAISCNKRTKTATVIASIYNDWLKNGGSVEAILGAICLNENRLTVGDLNNKKQKFEAEWVSYTSFYNSVNTNEYFRFVKGMLVNYFYSLYGELTPLEKDYLSAMPNLKDKVFKDVEQYVETLSFNDLNDVYCVCKYIVAKIRFFFTSSFDILTEMEKVGKDNPKASAEDASLIAAAKYISRYISDQYVIK